MIEIQVISALFAIFCAKHDAPAVSRFEFGGVSKGEMKAFHFWNNCLKAGFCAIVAYGYYPDLRLAAFSGGLAALWIYLLFDPVLNISRNPRKPWHYLGLNDGDGRLWNGLFGSGAGRWKAAILAGVIAAGNILLRLT